MASSRAIDLKRAEAVQRINKASTALAEKFKVQITGIPNVQKYDHAYGDALILEYFADVLTQIVDSTEPKEPAKPLTKMNKAELVAEAEKQGISVTPDSMTNKQIIDAIENGTVKIVNKDGDNFIVIPKSEFDEKTMHLWDDELKSAKIHANES